MRIALVGCGKLKLTRPAKARDLYIGTLFKLCRAYAEKFCDRWFILLAKHGLVSPNSILAPYDQRLDSQTRASWASMVGSTIGGLMGEEDTIVMLAGADYARAVDGVANVEWPLRGMPLGKQLTWLKREVSR